MSLQDPVFSIFKKIYGLYLAVKCQLNRKKSRFFERFILPRRLIRWGEGGGAEILRMEMLIEVKRGYKNAKKVNMV